MRIGRERGAKFMSGAEDPRDRSVDNASGAEPPSFELPAIAERVLSPLRTGAVRSITVRPRSAGSTATAS